MRLRALKISRRLQMLNMMVGLGLLLLGCLGLWGQWRSLRDQQTAELNSLGQVALTLLEHQQAAVAAGLNEDEAKHRALAAITALRYGADGYFLVIDTHCVMLAHPNPDRVGKDFSAVPDSAGFRYYADVIPRAMRDGRATVQYMFPHLGQTVPVKKTSLFVYDPTWHWLIATGIYQDTIEAMFWSSAWAMIGTALGVLLVVSGAAMVLIRSIVRPLQAVQGAMQRLADGQTDLEVPETEFNSEVGAMARTVLVFRDSSVARLRLEAEAKAATEQAAAERARQTAVEAAAAAALQRVVVGLAEGLSQLASGNLTYRLEQAFAGEYEALRTDYNGAMEQMAATMATIVNNTASLRSGASEMTQAADDLSRRTEQQAASLEQTAAALDEITATVRKTAEGAEQAREVVTTTRNDAEASGVIVREAVEAMSAIEASADKISKIISVIDEIAFQTNLLALNAGVEAARAGDAGRGFAVVASEVRALAQRSADAAREIKGLISTSHREVGRGVKLVGETGVSLTRIVTRVGQLIAVVSEIAHSAQEQSTALHQVNTAINQMDQVTQQNAAMVEQSTAASHVLATDTQSLVQLTEQFTLPMAAEASPTREKRRVGEYR